MLESGFASTSTSSLSTFMSVQVLCRHQDLLLGLSTQEKMQEQWEEWSLHFVSNLCCHASHGTLQINPFQAGACISRRAVICQLYALQANVKEEPQERYGLFACWISLDFYLHSTLTVLKRCFALCALYHWYRNCVLFGLLCVTNWNWIRESAP